MPLRLRELPDTASGDAVVGAISGIGLAALTGIENLVFPSGNTGAWSDARAGVLFGLFMFAWFRWRHHRKRRAVQPPASPSA
jgi:hypothetical protein